MSLPAEASAKAGATAVSPAGFPSHCRAGTALRLAGKMPVPRCAYTARWIVIVYRPPGEWARISYVGRADIFRLVARDPVLVGVLHVGVRVAGGAVVALSHYQPLTGYPPSEIGDCPQWPVDKPFGCLFRSLKGSKPSAPAVRRVADGPAQGRAKRRPG